MVLGVVGLLAIGAVVLASFSGGFIGDDPQPPEFHLANEEVGLGHYPVRELYSAPGSGRQGVYVLDYNNDHWEDLLVVGGSDSPIIYENTGSQFNRSGALPEKLTEDTVFKGALVFDYDNDGWEDIYLLRPHPEVSVFLENRNGTFHRTDVGLSQYFKMPNGATTLDYNQDGCLDVFVYQNGDWGDRNPIGYANPNTSVDNDNGNRNMLFRGNCSSFEYVPDAGISGTHWSLAASTVDFDDNGYPDIHVANDFHNDTLYFNRGDGTFERRNLTGATDRNGMASELADFNRDRRMDIFVTNIKVTTLDTCRMMVPTSNCSNVGAYILQYVGNRNDGNNLLINNGDRTFTDRAEAYGVTFGGWGWAASANDFDNDADIDLFHTTEQLSFEKNDNLSAPKFYERANATRFVHRNSTAMGFEAGSGRGLATLDFDRDGKLDIVIVEHPRNSVFSIHAFENRWPDAGNWLQIEVGQPPSGPIIGASVEIDYGNRTELRHVTPETDFFSQESRVIHLGLGDRSDVDRIRVAWPDGTTRTVTDVAANQKVVIGPDGLTPLDDEGDG